MRTHRSYPALQPWRDSAAFRELAVAESLTVMRIEPVMRARGPAAIVDLHFARDGRRVTIPLVLVDVAMLLAREADPLVFPDALAGVIDDTRVAAIIDRLFPDLERRALRARMWSEEVVTYAADPAFEDARERGWYAAAPLTTSIPRLGPALYARRFAQRKRILAYGDGAVETAAFLRDVVLSCTVAADDPQARHWFGDVTAEAPPAGRYDLAIGRGAPPAEAATIVDLDSDEGVTVSLVAPAPLDLLASFDPQDGPVSRTFAVTAVREPARRERPDWTLAPPVGGSEGRIALVVRPDAEALPDADVDEARALAQALTAEGFTVTVCSRRIELDAFRPDLVHLFGIRPGAHAAAIAAWTAQARVPLAVHAYDEDAAAGGYWGALVAPYCFAYSSDERSVSSYLQLLAQRSVEVDNVRASARYAPSGVGLDLAESVLRQADIVFVNSERERAAIEALHPRQAPLVVPAVPIIEAEPDPIGALVGSDPFVLLYAPLSAEANTLMVARAAGVVGAPLVIAGPVADPAYAELVREFAPDEVRLLPQPGAGTVSALFAAASVVVDASWFGRGHARIVSGALSGAAVVVSRARWTELPVDERWLVDPANVDSVGRGIGEAWDAAIRRAAEIRDLTAAAQQASRGAVRAIVAGYAKIGQPV